MCSKRRVDLSNCFPFSARTHRHTDTQGHTQSHRCHRSPYTHASATPAWVVSLPGRSDGLAVVVSDAHEVPAVVSTQMVDEVALGDPLGMSELLVVEVEVHPLVDHVVHRTCHRHLHALQ